VTDGSPRQVDHIAVLGVNASDPVQADDLGQKPVLSKNILVTIILIFVLHENLLSYIIRSCTQR
jgi:hypothetical protein